MAILNSPCTAKDPSTCRFHGGMDQIRKDYQKASDSLNNGIKKGFSFEKLKYLRIKASEMEKRVLVAEELELSGSKAFILMQVEKRQYDLLSPASLLEKEVVNAFVPGDKVQFRGEEMTVLFAAKPLSTIGSGEGKTDAYVLLKNSVGGVDEVKISIKKTNADFIENKISSSRAAKVFGESWKDTLHAPLTKMHEVLNNVNPIKDNGDITLGYRLDICNKPTGNRSVELNLPKEQVIDLYSGKTLASPLKDSYVKDRIRPNSGVANYMLVGDKFDDAQDILNQVQTIESYVKTNPKLYIVPKAVNLREGNKVESARPLGLFYKWSDKGYDLVSNDPLSITSSEAKDLVPPRLLR